MLGLVLMALFGAGLLVSSAEAETRTIEEVKGKAKSLALLNRFMQSPPGLFCGAELATLDVEVDDRGAVSAEVKTKTPVQKNRVKKLARTLPKNHAVAAMHCQGSGEDQIATGITVTHLAIKEADAWHASIIMTGESLPPKKPGKSDAPTDAEIEAALVEAARQINQGVPMVVDKNLRLDRVVGGNKTLQYRYTLIDHEASAVNTEEFRRGMQAILVEEICADEEMAFLFANGVKYSYRYQGKDEKEIATITVRVSDCK